jgi:hypothetical protein
MSRSRISLSRISLAISHRLSSTGSSILSMVVIPAKYLPSTMWAQSLQFRGPSTLWGVTLPDTCWIITDLVEGAFNIHRQSHLSPRHDQMVVVSPTSITVYGEHDVGLVGPISAKGWKDVDPYKARDIHHCFDRTDGGKEKEREKMECDGVDVIGAPASTSARRPAPIQQPQRWRWQQSQPQPPAAAPALSLSTSTNAPLPPSSLLSSAGRKHHDDFSIKFEYTVMSLQLQELFNYCRRLDCFCRCRS